MTFARFLSAQKVRTDWIGDLARAAAKDPRFPWSGQPIDMQDRIRSAMGGDAEALHAFQAALDEWNGGPYSLYAEQVARDREKRADIAAVDRAKFDAIDKRQARNARARELYREKKL
jgi:hypothetical protein